jgi:hypothetical protein
MAHNCAHGTQLTKGNCGHVGTQDRASGLWYKFNDQAVSLFEFSLLAHECFGGTERVTVKRATGGQTQDVVRDKPVTRSAYMLLYERAEQPQGESGDVDAKVRFCRYRFCPTGELKYRGAVWVRDSTSLTPLLKL